MLSGGLFGNARFRAYFGGQVGSMAGDAVALVALPVAFADAGCGPGALGLMTGVAGAELATSVVVGVVVDRVRREGLLAIGGAIRAAAQFAAFVLLGLNRPALFVLVGVYAVFGVGSATRFPDSADRP